MAKRNEKTAEYLTFKGELKSAKAKPRNPNAGPLLWAIDPIEHDVRHVRPLVSLLDLWARNTSSEIRPVSVLSPLDLDWPAELVKPLRAKLSSVSDRTVVPLIKRLRPRDEALAPTLLVQPVASVRHAVHTVVDYAKKEKASLIAVNTHGKRGLAKLLIGSFSETLLAYSPIPVLTLSPKAKVPKKITTILFPADLSREVHASFKSILPLAKRFGANIVLYHSYQDPIQYAAYSEWDLGIDPAMIKRIWTDAEATRRREGEKWTEEAARVGVRCEFVFVKQGKSATDAIFTAAKKFRPSLIAIATTMTPVGQALLGGTVKNIIAKAEQPVLVLQARK